MWQRTRNGSSPHVDRILVIRLGALGDVVRTLPAVSALRQRHPGSHLCWLVEPASEGAVALARCVDEILVFPRGEIVAALRAGAWLRALARLRRFVRMLRARRFELVLDFHGLAKSGLMALVSGAPVRVGHRGPVSREGAWLFVNERVTLASPRVSRFVRNAALVQAVEPEAQIAEGPILAATGAARERLATELAERGRVDARGFVLIHPGSSARAAHKRYAPSAWRAVARQLARAGREVWITGGEGAEERALVEAIVGEGDGAGRADARIVAAPPTRDLAAFAALLERAAVFAAGDTGPLHFAAQSGVPVVQLLGPTDPVHNLPGTAAPWRRVHVALPCSPCRRGCVDPACMRALPPAHVAEAILALAGSSAGASA